MSEADNSADEIALEGDPRNPNSDPAIADSVPMGKKHITLHGPDTKNPHKEGIDKNLPKDPSEIIQKIRFDTANKLFNPKSQN